MHSGTNHSPTITLLDFEHYLLKPIAQKSDKDRKSMAINIHSAMSRHAPYHYRADFKKELSKEEIKNIDTNRSNQIFKHYKTVFNEIITPIAQNIVDNGFGEHAASYGLQMSVPRQVLGKRIQRLLWVKFSSARGIDRTTPYKNRTPHLFPLKHIYDISEDRQPLFDGEKRGDISLARAKSTLTTLEYFYSPNPSSLKSAIKELIELGATTLPKHRFIRLLQENKIPFHKQSNTAPDRGSIPDPEQLISDKAISSNLNIICQQQAFLSRFPDAFRHTHFYRLVGLEALNLIMRSMGTTTFSVDWAKFLYREAAQKWSTKKTRMKILNDAEVFRESIHRLKPAQIAQCERPIMYKLSEEPLAWLSVFSKSCHVARRNTEMQNTSNPKVKKIMEVRLTGYLDNFSSDQATTPALNMAFHGLELFKAGKTGQLGNDSRGGGKNILYMWGSNLHNQFQKAAESTTGPCDPNNLLNVLLKRLTGPDTKPDKSLDGKPRSRETVTDYMIQQRNNETPVFAELMPLVSKTLRIEESFKSLETNMEYYWNWHKLN